MCCVSCDLIHLVLAVTPPTVTEMPVPVCSSQMRDGSQALKTRSRGFLCVAGSRRVVGGGGGGGGLNALEFGKFSEQTVNISSEDWPFMCFNICVLKTTAVAVHTWCQVCCKVAGRGPTLKSHDAVTWRPAAPGGRGRACSWPCWDGTDTGSPGTGPAEALRHDRAAGLVAFLSRRLLLCGFRGIQWWRQPAGRSPHLGEARCNMCVRG